MWVQLGINELAPTFNKFNVLEPIFCFRFFRFVHIRMQPFGDGETNSCSQLEPNQVGALTKDNTVSYGNLPADASPIVTLFQSRDI